MHPILLKLGPVTITSYGVATVLGFLVGILLAVRRGEEKGLDRARVYDLCFWIMVAGIVGSRIFYILIHLEEFRPAPLEAFMVWRGGLVYYGGVIAAVLVAVFYMRRNRLPVGKTLDVFSPSLAVAHALGRIGCLLNGCCFGIRTDSPLSLVFPKGSLVYIHHVNRGWIFPGSSCSLPVYPTQVLESLTEVMIFLLLLCHDRAPHRSGQTFCLYGILYGAARFFIGFLRGDQPPFLGPLTLSQLLSLLVFLGSLFAYATLSLRRPAGAQGA